MDSALVGDKEHWILFELFMALSMGCNDIGLELVEFVGLTMFWMPTHPFEKYVDQEYFLFVFIQLKWFQ